MCDEYQICRENNFNTVKTNINRMELFSVWQLFRPQGQSKHLKSTTPYDRSSDGSAEFIAVLARAAKSRRKNITHDGECAWGLKYVISLMNPFIKGVKDKNNLNYKKMAKVVVAVATAVQKVWW
jgi:hypothetical protein